MNNRLNISSGPHTRETWTTVNMMRMVVLALIPAVIAGVINHGVYAAVVIAVTVVVAVFTEMIFDVMTGRKNTIPDGSAIVTGLLLALTMPPSVPIALPILGAIFAILIAKCAFGGLGKNFVNPALAGRAFLLISFGKIMGNFTVDGVSSATPLAVLASGRAVDITKMFFGNTGGVIGNSIIAILIPGLILWGLDIIDGSISFSMLGAFLVFMSLFGGQGPDPRFLLAHLCGGGLMLGALFMATDHTTSPMSRRGQIVYGCIVGFLAALFRIKASSADSMTYSILLGNLFTPMIDMFITPKPVAYTKAATDKRNGVPKVPFFKKIPKPVIVLTVIALIAGISLSGVYTITKDTIDAAKMAKNTASYKVVCEDADHFVADEAITKAVTDLDGTVYGNSYGKSYINDGVVGVDAAGNIVGYVFSVTSGDGFDGNITLSVGMKPDGTLNGIAFTELNETPGMGMRAAEPEFKDQFIGKNADALVLNKGNSPGANAIDTVSGASTTSGAVVNAVNAAIHFFSTVVKGGN